MFESLKQDIIKLSAERDNMRTQLQKYISLLEKTYVENETLRGHVESITDENSKLKDSILQMQQMVGKSQQSIFGLMLQPKSLDLPGQTSLPISMSMSMSMPMSLPMPMSMSLSPPNLQPNPNPNLNLNPNSNGRPHLPFQPPTSQPSGSHQS
jgi:hypothetical protein